MVVQAVIPLLHSGKPHSLERWICLCDATASREIQHRLQWRTSPCVCVCVCACTVCVLKQWIKTHHGAQPVIIHATVNCGHSCTHRKVQVKK